MGVGNYPHLYLAIKLKLYYSTEVNMNNYVIRGIAQSICDEITETITAFSLAQAIVIFKDKFGDHYSCREV